MFFEFFLRPIVRAVFGTSDALKTADTLAHYALRRGFRTFRDSSFRKGASFTTLAIGEQDRIFNELVVSNLVLVLLMLDTLVKLTDGRVKEFCRAVCGAIPEKFLTILRATGGIVEENVELWRKLITLRQDEYEERRLEARSALPELGEGNPWLRVVGVGCLFHIRRGKSIVDDPLFSILITQAIAISRAVDRTIRSSIRRL